LEAKAEIIDAGFDLQAFGEGIVSGPKIGGGKPTQRPPERRPISDPLTSEPSI
jgi:hypothetical protein